MSMSIADALEREVSKLISRHNAHCRVATMNRWRYEKRSGLSASLPATSEPVHWSAHPHFNPFYVRARLGKIAHAISEKIRLGTYEPHPVLVVEVPKPDGGTREISVLTVPDASVSYALGRRLINRNAHFFSSYTYAYRTDRNAHHAIEHLMRELRGSSRLFVLEYDFSKYFDSIEHDYLQETLRQHFHVSGHELALIERMLRNRRAIGVSAYTAGRFETPTRGIPQGSTISLFLANVACHELDREIEHTGAVFARYADDTLILCDSYEKADLCARHILQHGARSGTAVNFRKSVGISLLTTDRRSEIRSKPSVDFLGHSLSADGVAPSRKSLHRIKQKISQIIHQHLLLQPSRGHFNRRRVGKGFKDWDLVTCVNELRRYIYGRIAEEALDDALAGRAPFNLTRGALSFYPTVDPEHAAVFKALDGWLADTLCRSYAKRVKLLSRLGVRVTPIVKARLISGTWYRFPRVRNETRLPSFFKSWLYVQRCARVFGLSRFPSPTYDYI